MFNFLQYRKLYLAISTFVIAVGLFSIATWGYKISIDFAGGTNAEYQLNKNVPADQIRKIMNESKVEVVEFEYKNNVITYRSKAIDEKKEQELKNKLASKLGVQVTTLRSETVGPVIGQEAIRKTAIASAIAVVGILLYIAFAFKNFNFALAAVLALFHDIVVVLGTYSLISHFYGAELDTLFVTALLTTMSFSVHDTIVVFDQIRDYRKKFGEGNIEEYANKALTETLVRSLNNSMTIIFMLLALVLLGGSTIRFFAITLLIGTLTGTYSSPFVATPIAVWLEKRKKK